jgi:hypothetical protein
LPLLLLLHILQSTYTLLLFSFVYKHPCTYSSCISASSATHSLTLLVRPQNGSESWCTNSWHSKRSSVNGCVLICIVSFVFCLVLSSKMRFAFLSCFLSFR